LKSIQEWFRPNLWKMKKDYKTGVKKLGFNLIKPDLEAYEKV